jgi:HD-like signal output (HDOD) protein
MNDNILKKIKAFPPLDDTIVRIQQICADRNSSLKSLVDVVESDPMLTANILKAANSPLYGFSREIKNISHAISLFGMATIRGFALSSAIKQNFKIDMSPYGLSNEQFLSITATQSAIMFNWYGRVDRQKLDILVPAAFLMEIGKIVIANELKENHKADEFKTALQNINSPQELSALEKKFVGFCNEDITAKIFEQWNLENELVEAIKNSNTPETATDDIKAYALALKIVKNAINSSAQLSDDSISNALKIIEENKLSKENFLEAVEKAKS